MSTFFFSYSLVNRYDFEFSGSIFFLKSRFFFSFLFFKSRFSNTLQLKYIGITAAKIFPGRNGKSSFSSCCSSLMILYVLLFHRLWKLATTNSRLVICFLNKPIKDITSPTFLTHRGHSPLLVSGGMCHPSIESHPWVPCSGQSSRQQFQFCLSCGQGHGLWWLSEVICFLMTGL